MKTQVYQNRNPRGVARTEIGIPLGEWVPGHTFYLAEDEGEWLVIHEQSGGAIGTAHRSPLAVIHETKGWLGRNTYWKTLIVKKEARRWQEIKARMWANAERDAT